MKRISALILAAILALFLVACGETGGNTNGGNGGNNGGGGATAATTKAGDNGNGGANASEVKSINDAYEFYDNIINALQEAVDDAVDAYNSAHEDDTFSLMYLPFTSLSVIDAVYFDDDMTDEQVQLAVSFLHDDAKATRTADGYTLEYTGKDYTDESTYAGKEVFKMDTSAGVNFSFELYKDGKIAEFLECVSLGGDKYALMNDSNRAIVTMKDGKAVEVLHASNIHDTDWETGELSAASVLNRYPDESIYGKTGLDRAWVTEHESENAINRLYELSGNTLKITGMNQDYNLDTGGYDYTPGYEKVLTF